MGSHAPPRTAFTGTGAQTIFYKGAEATHYLCMRDSSASNATSRHRNIEQTHDGLYNAADTHSVHVSTACARMSGGELEQCPTRHFFELLLHFFYLLLYTFQRISLSFLSLLFLHHVAAPHMYKQGPSAGKPKLISWLLDIIIFLNHSITFPVQRTLRHFVYYIFTVSCSP